MDISTITELNTRYHISDLLGIAAAMGMSFLSFVPAGEEYETHQLAVLLFFLAIFALRLVLFLWNRNAEGTGNERREQAKMMLMTAGVLLLMHSTFLAAVMYQMLVNDRIPVMASLQALAIAYGVYAFGKIVFSVYDRIRRKKKDLYEETLYYIGWIMAIYTLALYTNFLLITEGAYDYVWPKYIMIAVMGLTTIVMPVLMAVKAAGALRELKSSPSG